MKRLFRGLRGKPPNNSYDAVIIGAGIGGLICANLLAREGLSVLLTEQHYMVGGYCSTFRRKGYTFDAATHFYPLLGNPATITGKFLFDSMLRLSYFLGNYYPRGGSQAFADELALRFEERGGHILMGSTVRGILARNKRSEEHTSELQSR